ncbi:MAG: hypothetical protein OXF56_24105 [Rhodobacteraceae bacterium]|nr:hypothetical protein [Paracoccaceae bacterium]
MTAGRHHPRQQPGAKRPDHAVFGKQVSFFPCSLGQVIVRKALFQGSVAQFIGRNVGIPTGLFPCIRHDPCGGAKAFG